MAMTDVVISALDRDDDVEVVERKGAGHPDTICDALAETLSRGLCAEYQRRFGEILHHNVDKALLCGGRAEPAWGGGRVLAPIRIYLAGQATNRVGNEEIDLHELANHGSREWLRANLHALDATRDVVIDLLVRPGSQDLQSLFARRHAGLPLANDTSFGVGHAPLSPLERLVLAIEHRLHGRDRRRERPAFGEDVKVMAIRQRERVAVTLACAMIGRHLADIDSYLEHKAALAALVRACAVEYGFPDCAVTVNAADDAPSNVYLTVCGTSAESGDDGEVGRGNRVSGLITPCRAMSLEAAAGKNPVSHVGKIYNVLAMRLSAALVEQIPAVAAAQCLIVSQIGAPVTEPALMHVKLATHDTIAPTQIAKEVNAIARDKLDSIPQLIDELIAGMIQVY
jgi:S-adenosylmethionine synthetase